MLPKLLSSKCFPRGLMFVPRHGPLTSHSLPHLVRRVLCIPPSPGRSIAATASEARCFFIHESRSSGVGLYGGLQTGFRSYLRQAALGMESHLISYVFSIRYRSISSRNGQLSLRGNKLFEHAFMTMRELKKHIIQEKPADKEIHIADLKDSRSLDAILVQAIVAKTSTNGRASMVDGLSWGLPALLGRLYVSNPSVELLNALFKHLRVATVL